MSSQSSASSSSSFGAFRRKGADKDIAVQEEINNVAAEFIALLQSDEQDIRPDVITLDPTKPDTFTLTVIPFTAAVSRPARSEVYYDARAADEFVFGDDDTAIAAAAAIARPMRQRTGEGEEDLVLYALDTVTAMKTDPWYATGETDTKAAASKYRQRRTLAQRLLLIYQFFCMQSMFPGAKAAKLSEQMQKEVASMTIKEGSANDTLRVQRLLILLLLDETESANKRMHKL